MTRGFNHYHQAPSLGEVESLNSEYEEIINIPPYLLPHLCTLPLVVTSRP